MSGSKGNEKNWLEVLCHSCLSNDKDLIIDEGQIICNDCYHRKQKQSQENKDIADPPSVDKLKAKWESKKWTK